MVRGRGHRIGPNIVLDFSEPAVWWFVTRSSAIVGWILLTLSVLWGILLKTRILRGADNPEWLKVVHRFISGVAMLMVVTHVVSLYLDSYIEFTVADLLIPFSSEFEPWGVALGIVGMWSMVLVWLTSMVMQWIPQPVWKAIHYLSYLSVFAVALHSGMVGTDVGTPWYTALSIVLITAATLAGIIRIILTRRSQSATQRVATKADTKAETSTVEPTTHNRVGASSSTSRITARVVTRRQVTPDVVELTLTPITEGVELEWDAGAHITLHLGNGIERQYSLTGDPADSRSLTIAVLNTRGPGGGSQWIHDHVRVGTELEIDPPIQAFALKPAHRYQFVASGIGITPIRAMVASLPASREWELLYLGRHRDQLAYLDELESAYPAKVTVWASGEHGGRAPLDELLDSGAQIYACGSESLLETLEKEVDSSRLHLERFVPVDRSAEHTAHALKVEWQPTGQHVEVGPDQTILEGLESIGVPVNASCRRGVCGSCELSVVSGTPAHLDSAMADEDKDELGIMYPCVSRAIGDQLIVSPS